MHDISANSKLEFVCEFIGEGVRVFRAVADEVDEHYVISMYGETLPVMGVAHEEREARERMYDFLLENGRKWAESSKFIEIAFVDKIRLKQYNNP